MSRGFRGLVLTLVFSAVLSVLALVNSPSQSQAATGINSQVSFNGKVVTSTGVNIADGTYNMEFKLYSGGTATGGGTLIWTEDRLVSAGNGVTINGGTFQINLGSVTALNSSFFANDTLFLSMQVGSTANCTVTTTFTANCGGDGEMSPYIRFTSTPYAFTASQLAFANGANSTTLTFATPTAAGQSIVIPNASGTLCLQNSAACGFAAATGGTGYIQNGTSVQSAANFNISGNGIIGGSLTVTGSSTLGTLTATTGTFSGNLIANGDIQMANQATSSFSRTLPTATNDTVALGTVTLNNGTANFAINMQTSGGCFATSKSFNVTVPYNATGGAWQKIVPSADTSAFCGNDYGLEMSADGGSAAFRVRRLSGTDTTALNVTFIRQSQSNDTFAQSTAVTSGAAVVTALFNPSSMLQSGGNISIGTDSVALGARLGVVSGGAIGVLVRAASTQNGDLIQVQNSGGTPIASISPTGVITGTSLQSAGSITTGSTTAAGLLRLQDGTANNYRLTLAAQAMSNGSFTMTLPATGATGNQCLQSTSGSTWSSTSLYFSACASGGAVSLQTAYNNGGSITQSASGSITLTMNTTAPTADQLVIDNTGSSGVATAGVNGASIKYKGGASNIEAAGMRIDFAPGTGGGTWSGMRIVQSAASTNSAISYGLKLEGAASSGGTNTAIAIASGWDIGIDVQSGNIQLASTLNDPIAPTGSNLKIYAKTVAGRVMPKWLGPSGVDNPFQASLGFNRIAYATPNATANCASGFSALSTGIAGAGTCTVPTLASTNLLTSVRRISTSTTATQNTVAYTKSSTQLVWRGNAQNLGGFFFTQRFGFNTTQASMRFFTGLMDTNTAPTNVDALTNTGYGKIGVGVNNNTGNLFLINNTSGATPSTADLGSAFPVTTGVLYELVMYSPPNGSTIGWRVTNLSAEAAGQTNNTVSGTFSTNLPASGNFLAPVLYASNPGSAAAVIVDNAGWYLESDN